MNDHPPPLRILETVLYYNDEDEDAIATFYTDVLGFRSIGRGAGSFQFYRLGPTVFLLFNADRARKQSWPPPHGADGSVHACFVADEGVYEEWKEHLVSKGVEIVNETEWNHGGKSLYFLDPAGNMLEIGDKDFWPR